MVGETGKEEEEEEDGRRGAVHCGGGTSSVSQRTKLSL